MIKLGPEPEGLLLKRGDVFRWLPGLSRARWKKIHPTLRHVFVPPHPADRRAPAYAGQKPFYPKNEIRHKLVNPLMEESNP